MDAYWRLLSDCLATGSSYNPWQLAQNALRLPDVTLGGPGAKRSFRPLAKVMGCSRSFSDWLHAQLDVLVNSHSLSLERKVRRGGPRASTHARAHLRATSPHLLHLTRLHKPDELHSNSLRALVVLPPFRA